MNIEKVIIKNFRLLKDFELDLKKNLSLIVGKNNCGKTSILTIMDKLLNTGNNAIHFKWDDFNLEFQKEFYHKISNSEFNSSIYSADGISMTLIINYSEADSYANIQKFLMDLNPENNTIVLDFFYSCSPDKATALREALGSEGLCDEDTFSKFMKKYSNKYFNLTRYSKGYDSKTKTIIHDISAEINPSDIKSLISCYIIKANRDASNQANDRSLSNLSAEYYELKKKAMITDQSIFENLAKTIEEADTHLNRVYNGDDSGDSGIFSDIIKNIGLFGGVSGETKISIQSSIGSKELLKDNTILHYERNGRHLPENYNGLGYLNLIGIIFEIETAITGFLGKVNERASDINLLFIEEPEAHTHPQLQYIFIKNIKELINQHGEKLNIQTILTTHSAHIIADCDFNDIRYLRIDHSTIKSMNFESLNKVYDNGEDDDILAFKFIKQYLTLSHSELFFADKVIFIEGTSERVLLRAMMSKVDKNISDECLPLLSQNISVIEAGTYSNKFKPLIEFLGLKALVITDLDGTKKGIGETGRRKCPSNEAKYTSNSALKNFFDLPENEHFKVLTSKNFNEKLIDGCIRLAYQIEENGYLARSFEDAFFALNLDFIKYVLNKYPKSFENSLQNINLFSQENPNYYELAKKCVKKNGKSSFATDILYYDGISLMEEECEWKVPHYIKEGLEWLRKI